MATKIRLQRHGRKGYAFYPIVIADSRAPRDGKFIERIERALYWVNVGAIPTDTVRNILSREGVLMMKHLQGGVKKGAFTEEEARRRFEAWKSEKDARINAIRNKVNEEKRNAEKVRLEEETAKKNAKAELVAKKKAELAAKAAEEAAAKAAEAEAQEGEATAPAAE